MPETLDAAPRAQHIAEVVTALLSEGGSSALTLRSVADRSGLSLSSLRHHLENRQRLMSLSCHLAGMAHVGRFGDRVNAREASGLVAKDPAEVAADRGWLVWVELGRFDEYLSQHVADIEEREWHLVRLALGRWRDREPRREEVELLVAAVRGLRAARCRSLDPLSPGDALAALQVLAP